jgi:histone deacetylase complex regulatory component SIN3
MKIEERFIKYTNTDEYKEWFSEKIFMMFLRIVKDMKKDGFDIDDVIECLETLLGAGEIK